MKKFNVTGTCYPEKHYMVDIRERLRQIRKMVDEGDYFCIHKGRQYGKTTTLSLLKKQLENHYSVFFISFEGMGSSSFQSVECLSARFVQMLCHKLEHQNVIGLNEQCVNLLMEYKEQQELDLFELSKIITKLCEQSDRSIVLLVDEVDQAANYQAFIEFLGMLRNKYLNRETFPTFQTVILAGVYDVKNFKLKIRPDEWHPYNSPWNIAADFHVDMDFSKEDIEAMLDVYEADHQTGMNKEELAQLIYADTAGYPFLVSRLCKIIDERLVGTEKIPDKRTAWSRAGFLEAEKQLLSESNTLFDDMQKKLADYSELHEMLYQMLYEGSTFPYNPYNKVMDIAQMFGYIRNVQGHVMVSNRIFETWLYNLFVSEELLQSSIYREGSRDRNQFIENGRLDMKKILERFTLRFTDLYDDNDEKFLEKTGRKFFLFYLKPIINGTGNYYVEAQTRDEERTDVIVDYLGEQYIVELKIWRGNAYNERGEEQLANYLEKFHLQKGYMLSFNFNKKKEIGVKEIMVGDKILVEAVV